MECFITLMISTLRENPMCFLLLAHLPELHNLWRPLQAKSLLIIIIMALRHSICCVEGWTGGGAGCQYCEWKLQGVSLLLVVNTFFP